MRSYAFDPDLKDRYGSRPRRQPSKERVLAFIKDEVAAGRGFPNAVRIATHMGWKNESSAYDCLYSLVASRHLKTEVGQRGKRYWELVA